MTTYVTIYSYICGWTGHADLLPQTQSFSSLLLSTVSGVNSYKQDGTWESLSVAVQLYGVKNRHVLLSFP